MTISDKRFGAEILTKKGKTYKFDDAGCAISFLEAQPEIKQSLKEIFFADFSEPHSLIPSGSAYVLKSEVLKAPMGGMYSAFNSMDNLNKVKQEYPGTVTNWDTMSKP
jgi:copper chaperone NosL